MEPTNTAPRFEPINRRDEYLDKLSRIFVGQEKVTRRMHRRAAHLALDLAGRRDAGETLAADLYSFAQTHAILALSAEEDTSAPTLDELIEQTREKLAAELDQPQEGDGANARNLAVTLGILMDKRERVRQS